MVGRGLQQAVSYSIRITILALFKPARVSAASAIRRSVFRLSNPFCRMVVVGLGLSYFSVDNPSHVSLASLPAS